MLEAAGDLWSLHDEGYPAMITTNIGWKKDGCNPMGAGIAKEAAKRYPHLPAWYGTICKLECAATAVCYDSDSNLFLFPTKPFNEEKPWLSWRSDSCLELIKRSTMQLSALVDNIEDEFNLKEVGLPLPGCGNGNLDPDDVLPILRTYLDDRFVLFELS